MIAEHRILKENDDFFQTYIFEMLHWNYEPMFRAF